MVLYKYVYYYYYNTQSFFAVGMLCAYFHILVGTTVSNCGKYLVKHVPPDHPDGFFGIQTSQNSILAGALPDPAGKAYDAPPDPLVS